MDNEDDLARFCDDGGMCRTKNDSPEPFMDFADYVSVAPGHFVHPAFAGNAGHVTDDSPGADECVVPDVADLEAELHNRSKDNHARAGRIGAAPAPHVDQNKMAVQIDATNREVLTIMRDLAELRREVSAIRKDVHNLKTTVEFRSNQ